MAVEVTANAVFRAGTPKLPVRGPHQTDFTRARDSVTSRRLPCLVPVKQTGQTPFQIVLNWQAGLKK
jgi:hypothetical protein